MPTGIPRRNCKGCGREVEDRSVLSARGLCPDCSVSRQREATVQLIMHKGPWFDHWRERCRAAFGTDTSTSPDSGR